MSHLTKCGAIGASFFCLSILNPAVADNHGPTIGPVEIYACNFNSGKDAGDLAKVVSKWNAWMDENASFDYSGWLLHPYYTSTDEEFDALWLGAWKDGKAMGVGTDQWVNEGGPYCLSSARSGTATVMPILQSSVWLNPAVSPTVTGSCRSRIAP